MSRRIDVVHRVPVGQPDVVQRPGQVADLGGRRVLARDAAPVAAVGDIAPLTAGVGGAGNASRVRAVLGRDAGGRAVAVLARGARDTASSSRWLEPWISQYSSWTLRFHHVSGHGVGSSHGPEVAITGASSRAAEATL